MFPTLVNIGPFPIHTYGVLLVLGFIAGLWRAQKVAKRYGFTRDQVIDISILVLIAGVVGARIGFVLNNWGLFAGEPATMVRLWDGGLSFHGGLIAGILAGVAYAVIKKAPFWRGADMLAPSILLAYAIARIGCYLNGCCYGGVCSLPWAVQFPDEQNPGRLTPPSHPTQLYSMLINLALYAALAKFEPKRRFDGQVFAIMLIMQGVYRFAIEFLRAGATSGVRFAWVTDGHIIAGLIALVGVGLYLWKSQTATAPQPSVARS